MSSPGHLIDPPTSMRASPQVIQVLAGQREVARSGRAPSDELTVSAAVSL